MNSLDAELNGRLAALREQNLFRELRRVDSPQSPRLEIGGRTFLNFSSNDYLGLANDLRLKEAAIRAVEKFGAGAGAARLICGSLAPFHELEAALADFKKTGAALSFSSGYATAIGAICALLGKDDVIVLDKLVHACLADAARLSGAKIRVFAHNDLNDLEDKLKWASKNIQHPTSDIQRRKHVLVVTESIFSMDGDAAPLREMVSLKEKYGAWLMVDEAHATGLYGQQGRGLADELGVSNQIEIQMGTLGKALGASGGFICGSRALIELLVNRARSFIFSTAPVPAAAAAARAAIEFVQSAGGKARRASLWARVAELQSSTPLWRGQAKTAGVAHRPSKVSSAIVPIVIGDEKKAVAAAASLCERGIFVPAIRYPTVARGAARLRVTVTAPHTAEDISQLVAGLRKIVNRKS